ncbi:MAG: ribbon-helix-helix domain-containing protein [Oscillospiraceae bacterium]|nr:ribbon-helix-helix domain-containing protein [Oscillospiraceae bacterium]
MSKSIYSLVLSDDVVEAVDALANSAGISRSAMVNRILAERVAYTTPEMRLEEILEALARSINNGAFMLAEKPSGGTLSARTSLKYRYKPTVKYSVEIFTEKNGKRAGEMRVSFRTQNAQLIDDLTGFFKCWAALEQRHIADKLSEDILYTISDGHFTRTLNMPRGNVSDEQLGTAVADYMAMFDGAMKAYFLKLPDIEEAAHTVEKHYQQEITRQSTII